MASEIGTAYFQLLPKMEGTAGRIDKELSRVNATGAGNKIGDQLSNAINQSADIEGGISSKFSALAGTVGKMVAAAGIGAAITGAIKSGIQTGLDQLNLEGTLKAKLGNTAMASEAAQVAGDVYAAGWGDSLDTVGDSVTVLMQQLGQVDDSADFTSLTEQAMALADTFDQDVGGMATAAGQMIKTGLADNAQEAFDILTVGFQSGADMGGDLLDTFTEYPAQFEKLGLSGETAMGLISQGLQNGARNADLVADAVKEFSIRAVDGSETTKQGFEQLGLSADEMAAKFGQGGDTAAEAFQLVMDKLRGIEDPVERSAAAVNLFGTQAEDMGAALYSLDPSNAVSALGQIDGAAQSAADNSANLEQSFESLKRQAMQGLGEAFAPAIQGVVDALNDAMPTISGIIQGITGTIGGLVSGVGQAFQSIIGAIDFTPIQTLMDTLQTNFQTVSDSVMPVLTQLGELLGTVIGGAINTLMPLITSIGTAVSDIATAILPPLMDILNPIISIIQNVLSGVLEALGPVIDSISQTIQGVVQVLQGVIDFIVGVFTGNWSQAWDGIKQVFSGIWEAIKGVVTTVWNAISGFITAGVNVVKSVWDTVWGAISSFFSNTWNSIKSAASNAVNAVKSGISNGINAIKSTWSNIWNSIKSTFENIWNGIKSAASNAVNGLISTVSSIKDKVMGAISDAGRWLVNTGRDIINGLVNGIKGAIGNAVNAIKNAGKSIVNAAKSFFKIGSPSRVMRDEIGKWLLPGVSEGVKKTTRPLSNAIDSALGQAIPNRRTIMLDAASTSQTRPHDGTLSDTPSVGRTVINQTFNYPAIAPTVLTTQQRLQTAAMPQW